MLQLSPKDILAIWEGCEGRKQPEQGLVMLAHACPCITPDQLASLSVGTRDSLLLRIREQTFGPDLNAFASCPACRENLELSFLSIDFGPRPDEEAVSLPEPQELMIDDILLRFRLPSSNDLVAVSSSNTPSQARKRLIERCIIESSRYGEPIPVTELSDEVVGELAQSIAAIDPQAEVLLDLSCPVCRHTWQMNFDIVSYLYEEIATVARRLLEDVHELALAYGWSEKDILSMNAVRRQFYLNMVRG